MSEPLIHDVIIVGSGPAHRRLGIENEDKLSGRGVSYCATCDGAFFKDKNVAVVGGGDSAMEEALFLAKFAATVTVIVRGTELKASKIMGDRALNHPKIKFLFGATIAEIQGENKLDGIFVNLGHTGRQVIVDGLFIAIGNDPRTSLVAGQLELDSVSNCIKVEGRTSQTSERVSSQPGMSSTPATARRSRLRRPVAQRRRTSSTSSRQLSRHSWRRRSNDRSSKFVSTRPGFPPRGLPGTTARPRLPLTIQDGPGPWIEGA